MKLLEIKEGREVKVVKINGGCGLKKRLAAIGIYPGATIKVIKLPPGPFIIEAAGSRFALGKGMASKIEVEEVGDEGKG